MGLINEEQKKNASVKEPTIKAPKQAPISPVEGLTPDILGQQQQVIDEQTMPAEAPQQAEAGISTVQPQEEAPTGDPNTEVNLDFMPVAPVEIQSKPEPQILPTAPIWQDTSTLLGNGASLKPEVANSMLPSFSVQTPDNSAVLNQAFASNQRANTDINNQAQREAYAAAQQAQAASSKRGALPNTPDATKKWYSAPLGFMSDVLFGTERARKLSEAGVPDAGAGSFGRAGAGVGGEINYLLGTIPSLFVGAVGEVNKATANSLQALGVDKKTAEGFARNGFLQFLPDSPLKPSRILNFNFDEANKRNLVVDAIAGDPLTDVNDPDGATKYGRIYTRSQRKEGSSAVSDPVGFALQLGTYIFNPGEIPGDELVSLGINKLFSTIKKPAAKLAEVTTEAATKAPIHEPDIGFSSVAPTPEQLQQLNKPQARLNQAPTGSIEFVAPNAPELNPPRLDVGEARLEYPTNAHLPVGANPQLVPRAYTGDNKVTRALLPPAFNPSDVPKTSIPLLPYNSPAKLALDVGLGNPLVRIEQPGALAIRSLSDVKQAIESVDPKLVEDFTGNTWEELKTHLSDKVDDIGQFSSVGVELPRRVSMQKIRDDLTHSWTTYDLETYRPDIFATPETKAKSILGEGVDFETKDYGSYTISNAKGAYLPAQGLKAVDDSEKLLREMGLNTPEPTNVTFVDDFNKGGVWNDLNQSMLVSSATGDYKTIRDTYLHESAHKLDLYLRSRGKVGHDILDTFAANPLVKKYYPSNYASKRRFNKSEVFAEALTNVLTDRARVAKESPEFLKLVEDTIEKIKPVLADLPKPKLSTDDLLTGAEELALHKASLDVPLQKLSDLFESTVDFGRKNIDEALDIVDPIAAKKAIENGGLVKLEPKIFSNADERKLWQSGDYDSLVNFYKRQGLNFDDILPELVQRNNSYIVGASKVNPTVKPSPALTTIDAPLYHGTALDSWRPPDNLYVNGSRGELGHGTYLTLDKQTAADYARARVGENVSPKTMDVDLNPTVAESKSSFVATLDARTPDNELKQAFADLPATIEKEFTKAFNKKKKPLSLLQMRELMEESIVKAGVEPTEELLTQVDTDISKNLRGLGYDSVLDKESGFVLSLDNSKLSEPLLSNVPKPSTIEAAAARYNADAHAAKHYPNLLTTDANLRDSTYKVLDQTREAVDRKLAQTQDEIIQRGIPERDSVLPNPTPTNTKPQSFVEAVEEVNIEDICSL